MRLAESKAERERDESFEISGSRLRAKLPIRRLFVTVEWKRGGQGSGSKREGKKYPTNDKRATNLTRPVPRDRGRGLHLCG